MMTEVREQQIISDMSNALGPGAVLEWCGHTSRFIGDLLRSDKPRVDDLEAQIALGEFFMEVVKKHYDVDPELMELETAKCYRNMEKMLERSKQAAAEETTMMDAGDVLQGFPSVNEIGDCQVEAVPISDTIEALDATAEEISDAHAE